MNLGRSWNKIEPTTITKRWIPSLSFIRDPRVISSARTALAVFAGALFLPAAGCHSSPQPKIHSPVMSPPDLAGANAFISPFFSAEEFPDSPKPANPQWRGVLIAAPARTVLTLRQPMVIVRGTYRIQGTNYPARDRLKLVAVDLNSKKEYSGLAGQRDASPDAPRPPSKQPDPETFKRMVFSGFFNADLVATLGLPRVSASYRVWAELGPIRSNEITLHVVAQ
jgi:hypothetical protein